MKSKNDLTRGGHFAYRSCDFAKAICVIKQNKLFSFMSLKARKNRGWHFFRFVSFLVCVWSFHANTTDHPFFGHIRALLQHAVFAFPNILALWLDARTCHCSVCDIFFSSFPNDRTFFCFRITHSCFLLILLLGLVQKLVTTFIYPITFLINNSV